MSDPQKDWETRCVLHPSGKVFELYELADKIVAIVPKLLALFHSEPTSNGEFSFSPVDDKAAESILTNFALFMGGTFGISELILRFFVGVLRQFAKTDDYRFVVVKLLHLDQGALLESRSSKFVWPV